MKYLKNEEGPTCLHLDPSHSHVSDSLRVAMRKRDGAQRANTPRFAFNFSVILKRNTEVKIVAHSKNQELTSLPLITLVAACV